MGYNARNDEIHENLERMRREREAYEVSLAIVRQFNARLSAKKTAWFWPTVGAALASKHHWLIIACDACDTVIDLDLTLKRRNPDAPIRVVLNDVRCPRCNGHGRTRIVGLSRARARYPRHPTPSGHPWSSLNFMIIPESCACIRARMAIHQEGVPVWQKESASFRPKD